ncbi:hypothetical protein BGX28_010237 [Mortierella sp. GBA30]|nr:hypothetical protein BGX28_010237 [Mortierella sp. GBA30]
MAKRKTSTRKTRQAAAQSTGDARPYRGASKHVSASPSVVSSPSPQPQDLVQRRRKGNPVRSPAQGDPTKGIVFAFRIKNDSDLSMAVDILSYDQIPEDAIQATDSTPMTAVSTIATESEPKSSALETTVPLSSEPESPKDNVASKAESVVVPANVRVAGETWSSDPSSYLTSNVVDLSRNVLILHCRKPQDSSSLASSFHPYRRSSAPSRSSSLSQPSTPPFLTDSQSSSSSSSTSSSPSTSPSSPTMLYSPSGKASAANEKDDLSTLDALSSPPSLSSMSLPLGGTGATSRILNVRGLGAGQRKMKVYLV